MATRFQDGEQAGRADALVGVRLSVSWFEGGSYGAGYRAGWVAGKAAANATRYRLRMARHESRTVAETAERRWARGF